MTNVKEKSEQPSIMHNFFQGLIDIQNATPQRCWYCKAELTDDEDCVPSSNGKMHVNCKQEFINETSEN